MASPVYRLSVDQYHQMIDTAILTEDDSVELLEGWLIYKMPKKPPHRVATKLTRNALEELVSSGYYVDSQEPITLATSEPEPDVVVVRGNTRDYADHHPTGEDVAMVVEISDSTLERDRTLKKQIYAQAGIAVYWIVNLAEKSIEVYTAPVASTESATYQGQQVFQLDAQIPVVIDKQQWGQLEVKNLLP